MRVRMRVSLSGPGLCLGRDDEHEFEDAEAIRLCERGYAVPVAGVATERAIAPPAAETRAASAPAPAPAPRARKKA